MSIMMKGTLSSEEIDDFSGYTVEATFAQSQPVEGEEDIFVPTRIAVGAHRDGTYQLTLPADEARRGSIDIKIYAPDGLPAGDKSVAATGPFDPIDIEVRAASATEVSASSNLTLGQQVKYTGRAIDPAGRGVPVDLLLVIWARREAGTEPVPVSVTRTTTGGYFSAPWPPDSFVDARAVLAGGTPVPIALDEGHLPLRMVLVFAQLPQEDEKEGCSGTDAPPRSPDAGDLAANPEAYAADTQRCVDFTIPNRTIDEVAFQAVVRTTQPQVKGSIPEKPIPFPGKLVDRLAELAKLRPIVNSEGSVRGRGVDPPRSIELNTSAANLDGSSVLRSASRVVAPATRGGVLSAAAVRAQRFAPGIELDGRWTQELTESVADQILSERAEAGEPLRLEPSVLAELAHEQSDLTPLRLVKAEQTSVVRRFRETVGLLSRSLTGRFALDESHQIDWDELPDPYQTISIAHGHLLTLKQVWRADGYSFGDLLYSLPLAPGQQKLVSVLDWNRREVTARRAERTVTEEIVADLSHDSDISDVIRSTLTETMRGQSRADTSAVGGGIAGFVGPLVFGAAGGVSSAGSSASQTSARSVTGQALNRVRDRTLQSASAVRGQRATVVQTARQGESVRAQTEVVANYNHCHALTIEYFEVLRHLQVSQELAAVQECLFVPFAISPFNVHKALRWRHQLRAGLRTRSMAPAFDALQRMADNWAGADYPLGRYADDPVVHLEGELWVRMTLPRPADGDDGEFVEDNWDGYVDLLWESPENIFERYLGVALPQSRNAIWDTRIAPGIAQRLLAELTVELIENGAPLPPISVDPTMVGRFSQDRPLLVSVRPTSVLPNVLRSDIDRVRLSLAISNLAPGAEMVVDSATFHYRTEHLSHHLFLNRRIQNDLTLGDDVEIATPIDLIEKRNPRETDRRLAERLLDHLNEHVEHYHRAIWLTMDPNRRFLLLDGFIAPDAGGRSVASVVENRVIGVVGNSLVMPVVPGMKLDSTYEFAESTPEDLRHLYAADPPPPMRISLPTAGVFAEAVLGKCNSCEEIDDTRFWRWEDAPIPDRPPSIDPLSTGSRRREPPSLKSDAFPDALVRYQDVPSIPDPTGLAAAMAALGTNNIFKDLTGLALNQENAAAALKTSITAAQGFASKAGALAQQRFLNQELDRSLSHIKEARDKKLIPESEARRLTESALRGAIGETRPQNQSPTKSASVQRAMERVATSNSGALRVTRPEGTVEVNTGKAAGRPLIDVTVNPAVVPIKQLSNLVCWAAAGAMMEAWRSRQSTTVEAFLDALGGQWRAKYDRNEGLTVVELRAFVANLNMIEEGPVSYTPEGLARLVEQVGPLFEIGDDGVEANQISHVRIITGVKGDATADGTMVTLADPATGTTVTETFNTFDRRHAGTDPVALGIGVFHF